jgi:hypothetical protein
LDSSDDNIIGLIYRDPEGWIPIQTRGQFPSYQQDFFSRRNWSEYANGFGDPGKVSMKVNTIMLFPGTFKNKL